MMNNLSPKWRRGYQERVTRKFRMLSFSKRIVSKFLKTKQTHTNITGLFRSAKVSTFCVNSSISPSLSNFEPEVSAVACCFLGGFSNHSRDLKQDDLRAFPAASVNFCGRPLIDHNLSANRKKIKKRKMHEKQDDYLFLI